MKTSRRTFIKVIAASGGALLLGVRTVAAREGAKAFQPNVWLRVERDGTVTILVGKSEMGQGVRTSLPMIVAEELDAKFEQVRIEQASPGADFKRLGTGGSGSIMRSWDSLREAGAAARLMLVAAAATRWSVPASELETEAGAVVHKASKRRLEYGELAAEAAKQPVPEKPALKARGAFRIIGQSQKRIDVPEIVTGKARYGLDVRVPGMLRAVVARAPQFGSKVKTFDDAAAKKVPGVRHVLQIPSGVAVVAENTWAAMRGREALKVEWTASPHAKFDSGEHMKALERANEKPPLMIRKDGAGRAAFETVSKKMEATYLYPFAAHASVEPVNCTVLLEDEKATVWSPTQTPNGVHAAAAKILGMPEEQITVHVPLLGGGFGRRLGVDFDTEALEVAKQLKGTPVQLVWSRDDDMKHGYFQAASAHHMAAGLDDAGNLVAWDHRKASTPHNARGGPPKPEQLADPEEMRGYAWGVYDMPYYIAAAEMSYAPVDAPVPIGPWRSVFSPPSVFARECFVDEVAEATKKDPLKMRLALLTTDDKNVDPILKIADEQTDRRRLRKVLETVAEKAGWDKPVGKGRARGLACNVFHTETYIAYVVEVSLRTDAPEGGLPFRVERVVCALDCGVAVNPLGIAQQVESGVIWSLSNMKNEITVKNGAVEQGFYSDFPVVMIDECPASIETHLVPNDDERPHGLGEPAVCPLAPAVANALSRLVNRRIRALPVRARDLA